MKYIRTKYGIYEIDRDVYVKDNEAYMRWFDGNGKEIESTFLGEVIKETDTIEELCDRFVTETCDNYKYWVELKLEYAKTYCGIKNIYGAIWVDGKGLIYVAKMNEDGELVLI